MPVSPEIEQSFGIDFAFISTIFLLDFGTDLDYVFFHSVCFLFVLFVCLFVSFFVRDVDTFVAYSLILKNFNIKGIQITHHFQLNMFPLVPPKCKDHY
jgi:hypothetical protein